MRRYPVVKRGTRLSCLGSVSGAPESCPVGVQNLHCGIPGAEWCVERSRKEITKVVDEVFWKPSRNTCTIEKASHARYKACSIKFVNVFVAAILVYMDFGHHARVLCSTMNFPTWSDLQKGRVKPVLVVQIVDHLPTQKKAMFEIEGSD